MSFDVDFSEIRAFAADLGKVSTAVALGVSGVVAKAAVNTKTTMRADMSKSAHFGQVARSINYDQRNGLGFSEAEIGPETGGRVVGDLAHIAYFGGARGGGGSVRDPQDAANEEAPKFEKALLNLADGLL